MSHTPDDRTDLELVGAAELQQLLADPAAPSPVVVDVRYWLGHPGRGREVYLAGHLPGARFADVDADLAEPPAESSASRPGTHPGGRHPRPSAERLATAVARLGIDEDSTVVVHDQRTNLASAWFWWLLRDAGFTGRILLLDGGFEAWQASGGATEPGEVPDGHGSFVPRPGRLGVVDAEQVPVEQAQGHFLFDVRAPERFRGESESVDPVAGHVPGARNLPATSLFAADGRFLATRELTAALQELRPGDMLSCGSGLTASQVLAAAQLAGHKDLRLYAGSWSDWISDPARPVEP